MARRQPLSDFLHEARLRRGISVRALSDDVGVSPAAIYGWETGRNRPRETNLKAVCRMLKLPIRTTLELANV